MRANTWQGKNKVEVTEVPDPQLLNRRDAIVQITSTAMPSRRSPRATASATLDSSSASSTRICAIQASRALLCDG